MEAESFCMQMARLIKDRSFKTKYLVTELISGLTADSILASGIRIKCMEKVFLLGQMAVNILENMYLRKNRAMGNFSGQTDVLTKATGKTVNKME